MTIPLIKDTSELHRLGSDVAVSSIGISEEGNTKKGPWYQIKGGGRLVRGIDLVRSLNGTPKVARSESGQTIEFETM